MEPMKFTKDEKALMVSKVQLYFREELDREIGGFDAEFLIDFFAEEIGPYFYNRGLYDAQAILESRMEQVAEAIYDIEKPTEFSR